MTSAEAGHPDITARTGGEIAAGASPARWARRRHSLLWRLSLIDVSVLVVIVLLLAFTPITISAPPEPVEVAVLLAGFVVIAAANLWLLRRAVAPLHRLSQVMESIDPMDPGTRVRADRMRDAELITLANSFNAMLDRLSDQLPAGRNGIAGMRERAMLVGGTLSLRSTEGEGTDVKLEIPLAVL